MALTFKEFLKKKVFAFLGLASVAETDDDKFLVNDPEEIRKLKLKEYNVWYSGDSDNLLNFYTRANIIDYNYEPYFDRNKMSYFWAISSTEDDIKRTHSGQPRNIVDTLVNIVGLPEIKYSGKGGDEIDKKLRKIFKDNKFRSMFLQEQLPMTLVEGWGCYKINYDTVLRDTPIILYYRADACEFVYTGNQLLACVFKDYYVNRKGEKFLLIETRRTAKENGEPCLYIEKDLFRVGDDGENLVPAAFKDLPQLADVEPRIRINNYAGFLAVPCIIYRDNENVNFGRSIFTGKIDLFDDLDQCLSQAANTVRRSTAREYFNINFLERDDNGMPIMPTAFDRKYTMYTGGRSVDGSTGNMEPVQTTQPALNFSQYDSEAMTILIQIVNGIMSPATLGIDIAKKDNAAAQREKEKVTLFTRNTIIAEEMEILESLSRELLCASELMNRGEITARDYEISVMFDDFNSTSFEGTIETMLALFKNDVLTPEMFVDKVWKDKLSPEEKRKQVDYIVNKQNMMMGMQNPYAQGPMGAMGADNEHNAELSSENKL